MTYIKLGFATAAIVWLTLVAGVLFWNLAPSINYFGLPTRAAANEGVYQAGSIGKRRYQMLVEATRLYMKSGAKIAPGVAGGKELAPVPFLNRELERQGVKWRVRSTDGLTADTYEIS